MAIKVYGRNKLLQVRFLARVKRRLGKLNEESGIRMDINIKLTDAEKASLDSNRGRCCLFRFRTKQRFDEAPDEQKSDQVSNSTDR